MSLKQLLICFAAALPIAACGTTTAQSPTQSQSGSKLGQADADYVTSAYQIVELDNQEGKLAATKATDPRVRAVAAQLTTQANMLYPQLQATIKSNGIKAPDRLPRDLSGQVDKLKGLDGTAFDRQYLADQVQSHQRAVEVFKKEASATQDAGMRNQVQTALPVVQDNLGRLKYLANAIK